MQIFRGQGLENWKLSNVTNMFSMFKGCDNFINCNLEKWNKYIIKADTREMFLGCWKIKYSLPSWYKE